MTRDGYFVFKKKTKHYCEMRENNGGGEPNKEIL
jgi:hypothetical protein